MAFGFDPSIILSATKTAEPTPNETLRTLSDLATARNQQGLQQASLREMLYNQQRQRSLADLVSQNAGSYTVPAAQSFARGGFGAEADEREKLGYALEKMAEDQARTHLSTVKTPEQYSSIVSQMTPAFRARHGLGDTYDPNAVQGFLAGALPLDKRASFEDEQRRRAQLQTPNSPLNQFRGGLVEQLGGTVPAGLNTGDLTDKEFDTLEHAQAAKENAAWRRQVANTRANSVDVKSEEKKDQFNTKREDQLSKALDDTLNANKVRGGLKGYTDTIARVNQIKGQVLDPDTGRLKDQLDTRQMAELAITLQQAVANGHANAGEVEMLIPHTLWGNSAKTKEYLTGHPWDTGQREIAEKMLHSAENAANVAHSAIIDSYRQNVVGPLMGLRSIPNDTARKRANATLRRHGINPDAIDDNGDIVDGVPFELKGGSTPKESGGSSPSAASGMVKVRRKADGTTKTLAADAAAKYLSDPGYEVVR